MSNDLAVRQTGEAVVQYKLGQEEIATLIQSNIIPQGTPEGTIKMFARFCGESNLSPFKRQVHLVRRGEKFTIQTGIDGYRAIANRTGLYAGSDDYLFDEGVGEYEMLKSQRKTPTTAKAIVYRLVSGVRCPFTATAGWKEYAQVYNGKLGTMWEKMPFLMLGKCAEALALRKAFPEELGGLYTDEEMQQAEKFDTNFQDGAYSPVESTKVEVKGTSFTEFDPKTEKMQFGKKYNGQEWWLVQKDYLEWMVKECKDETNRKKAELTLKYLESLTTQETKIDDFAGVFDKKEEPQQAETVSTLEAPLIDIILSTLDEVALKNDKAPLVKWAAEKTNDIAELTEDEKKVVRNAYQKELKKFKENK